MLLKTRVERPTRNRGDCILVKMLSKILKIGALVFATAFIAIQFFRIDQTPPPINEADTLEAALTVPPDISLILGRSCNDCHSHKTVYPWYANIQPTGWFLKDHIEHGSEHLNLSVFNTYSRDRKAKKLDEICEEVESQRMPLPSYLLLHRDAVLTEDERQSLCAWAQSERDRLSN